MQAATLTAGRGVPGLAVAFPGQPRRFWGRLVVTAYGGLHGSLNRESCDLDPS